MIILNPLHEEAPHFEEYINDKIHQFLTVEVESNGGFKDEIFIEGLEAFFPDHLIREQREECIKVFEDLFYWTGDPFLHTLTPFHEIGLYGFLQYIQEYREDIQAEFDSIYYDEDDEAEIKKIWARLDKRESVDLFKNINDLRDALHDIEVIIDYCFEDIDFITFPYLLGNLPGYKNEEVPQDIFNYFKDLLPRDIREKYETKKPRATLVDELYLVIDFISHGMRYLAWDKLFWNGKVPLNEHEIQLRLDIIFNTYFKSKSLTDITREADIGTGKIDFKFYANNAEKVLVEVKLGGSKSLVKGLKKQLLHYMDALQYESAFYLIICHTRSDVRRSEKLLHEHDYDKRIIPIILDATQKTAASRL